ncbi:S-adenosyl-L-methionine-dependent methyltransferase [Nemania sp. NC0429]|nr:S-adenosyl-L-methionine-dependent methyltransferase [Nemania sp. NC0429]
MASIDQNAIVHALDQVASDGAKLLKGDPTARGHLVESARQLIAAAETPPTRNVAARIAIDLKIFETSMKDNGCPKTSEELAAVTGASPVLVKRVARACVSMNMLDEHSSDRYLPNKLTELLLKPLQLPISNAFLIAIAPSFDITALSFAQLPTYLKNTGFRNPDNALDGPFQHANKCGSAFTWLTERPENFRVFHAYIHALRLHRPSWSYMYPVQDHLINGLKGGDASAFVGVGGGTGQILQAFREHVPRYPGTLVLQEIPEVIDAANGMGVADSGVVLQVHDFFTPQPIKGARAYFMRSGLHDWPDDQCRQILGHLKDAMEPGYSRILISECVVADQGASWQHVALDLFMIAQISAQERTESEWRRLIEGCGLKVEGIYTKGEDKEGLIEVILGYQGPICLTFIIECNLYI